MNTTKQIYPKLVMNEIVGFGGRFYTTSISYPSGDYEFEPVGGAKCWSEIKWFSRQRVANGIKMGAIKSLWRPEYKPDKKALKAAPTVENLLVSKPRFLCKKKASQLSLFKLINQ